MDGLPVFLEDLPDRRPCLLSDLFCHGLPHGGVPEFFNHFLQDRHSAFLQGA